MDTSKQNSDTTKTDVKNLLIDRSEGGEYQLHATIFSTDATTESDETISILKKHWDIENQEWVRTPRKVALKSLNNSSNINNDFLNEINYYISGHVHASNTVACFGITQDPNTKDYMMVLEYCDGGNLRNTLTKEPVNSTDYLTSYQETISSSSENPISECLDCELNELDLNQDDDE
ncbi:unnamed protein product [Rhizophagus irregularis]|nr:unnamed protein product [Rhizophagus irregularis]